MLEFRRFIADPLVKFLTIHCKYFNRKFIQVMSTSSFVSKYDRSTEAVFEVNVQFESETECPKTKSPVKPYIEARVDLGGIYGKEGYPTPGEGSFLNLLRGGVWSQQLKVRRDSILGNCQLSDKMPVGKLFLSCKWRDLEATKLEVPCRWGADIVLLASDFNQIFKDSLNPCISKHTRMFYLINKLIITSRFGRVKGVTFICFS